MRPPSDDAGATATGDDSEEGRSSGREGHRHSGNRAESGDASEETVRVWLVERTYSDDEQNLIILVYATPDGERYLRRERALTSFDDHRDTTAALDADPENLGRVDDQAERERYAAEAERMAEKYEPDDLI